MCLAERLALPGVPVHALQPLPVGPEGVRVGVQVDEGDGDAGAVGEEAGERERDCVSALQRQQRPRHLIQGLGYKGVRSI